MVLKSKRTNKNFYKKGKRTLKCGGGLFGNMFKSKSKSVKSKTLKQQRVYTNQHGIKQNLILRQLPLLPLPTQEDIENRQQRNSALSPRLRKVKNNNSAIAISKSVLTRRHQNQTAPNLSNLPQPNIYENMSTTRPPQKIEMTKEEIEKNIFRNLSKNERKQFLLEQQEKIRIQLLKNARNAKTASTADQHAETQAQAQTPKPIIHQTN